MSSASSPRTESKENSISSFFMNRCLHLAALGAGTTAPNPLVGAVLVHEGRIIGEGYHEKYGSAHAEVNCIGSVKPDDRPRIPFSTLYVSLEPCCHQGKTPPCTELIIREKIPHVVVGCRDPFEAVNGKGIEQLRLNGIKVEYPVLEKETMAMNRRFFTFHHQKRPYIILKWAQTANFKIAGEPGKRISISNAFSNRLVHKWRSEEAGILIGTQTALLDNPQLTTRLWPGKNPVRIVLDQNLRLPDSLNIFDGHVPTLVLNSKKEMQSEKIIFKKINAEKPVIPAILEVLHNMNILSVLVEGGSKLIQSFISAGIWDETRIITNNEYILPEGMASPVLQNAKWVHAENYGSDTINYYSRSLEQ